MTGLGAIVERFGAWVRGFPAFTAAMLFALAGQLLAAGAMLALDRLGVVDFNAADPGETGAFHVLASVFVLQIVFLIIAIASSGLTFRRAIATAAAMTWSLGLLMLLYVSLQCWLYGACL